MSYISYKNSEQETEDVKKSKFQKFWKFKFLFFVLIIGFLAILVRLFIVQVINADKYKDIARKQHEARDSLIAERGNIYDRNGKLLASTYHSISFAADPKMMQNIQNRCLVASLIKKYIGTDSIKIINRINEAKGSFVWLSRGVSPSLLKYFDTLKIKGFIIKNEPKRNYLYGSTGAQVIGCTDIDNRGLTGIEYSLDSVLKGKKGYIIRQKDAKGNISPASDLPIIPAQNGQSVKLTIDIDFQRIVEYELQQGVKNSGSESGTVIAMDISSGEILAMASYPTYDPNIMDDRDEHSMRNRAITDVYEPGSTFKLITAAAALEQKIISPENYVDGYKGLFQYKDIKIVDEHPLGRVQFKEAVVYSSNIVFSNLGNSIPDNIFYKYVRDFGFGLTLGIDLQGEVTGFIKKPESFESSTKRFMGFGYGIAVTPLQMLSAYSAVANKGVLMKPYVISEIYDEYNGSILVNKPEKIRTVITENTSKVLTDLFCSVVERGTGINAKIEGLKIAGKTGTAQQYIAGSYKTQSYTASFVGFFPADAPKVAVIVVLDKPTGNYYGGAVAAPIFRNIVQRWLAISPVFSYLKINSSESNISDSVSIPNITGFFSDDASRLLKSKGLNIANLPEKRAIVLSQTPKEYSKVKTGTQVYITINNDKIADNKKAGNPNSKPSVVGLTLRRAIAILHQSNIKTKIKGSGKVKSQIWSNEKDGSIECTLICE